MIALIFNLMTLFIIHINFYKYYNILFNLKRSILYYLIIFFFFVRMDVLNSIHSFNSFSVLNNFNSFLIIITFIYICIFLKSIKLFYIKYFPNKFKFIPILSVFFKLINLFFFYYFFLNLYYVLYSNYQFIDITKYFKILLLILCYLTFKLELINFNFFLLIFLLIFLKFIDITNIFIAINVLVLYKNYS